VAVSWIIVIIIIIVVVVKCMGLYPVKICYKAR